MTSPLMIAMVAGEASGDSLAASAIREIKNLQPDVQFFGIGGPLMLEQGFRSWFDMERLSVNGFIDPLKRLPELLNILLTLKRRLLKDPPGVFVGVDFNFFNLLLSGMLKKAGIPTVQYVSPSVWAWRQGRLKKIAKAVDLMLTLYPFETEIYRQRNIAVRFVGHPKADEIPLINNPRSSREELGFNLDDKVVAILPGSRSSEVKYSGGDFFKAANICHDKFPQLKFVVPSANPLRKLEILQLIREISPHLEIKVLDGNAQLAISSADVVLVNSGTATLEAMLLKRPMVMSYRLGNLTYAVVSRLVKTPYFALPNILAGKELVPELLQHKATPQALAKALLVKLEQPEQAELMREFEQIHRQLQCNAGARAAEAILELVEIKQKTDPPSA